MRFEIICTGYNCQQYVQGCVDSVKNQTHQNWRLQLISDGSTDATGAAIHRKLHSKVNAIHYGQNRGAAFRRWQAIQGLDSDSVILFLGMDDELLPDCLEMIAKEYEAGAWMTYGNWINQNGCGLPEDFELDFDDQTHADRSYRKAKYRSTAPNTFKKFLFDQIPVDDFKIDGEWIKTATEAEVMLSCLEMSGRERIAVIRKQIYMYRQNLKNNSQTRYGQAYKNEVYQKIANRKKRNLYEKI